MSQPDPFDRAVELQEAGRLAEAEALCRQILAADPKRSSALLMLGMIRAQCGGLPEALQLITRSLGIAPDVPLGHFYQAVVLAGLGRTGEAVRSYQRAAEYNPEFVEAYYNCGHLLVELNRPEPALDAFDRVVRLRPEFLEAYCARAVVLSRLNRPLEALADLDGVLKRNPRFTPALNMRSALHCELGRYADALADNERSLALDPNQAEPYVSRCTALLATHRLVEAKADIERALALEPDSARALGMRGAVLRELCQLTEALADCDRAVSLAPNDAAMHISRGDTLMSMGRHEEALQALTQAAALNPRLAKIFASRALALRHLQRFDEALADCDRALALDPRPGEVAGERYLLGALLCDWRQRAAGLEDLKRRVREGTPVSPWVIVTSIDEPALQLAAARRMTGPTAAAPPRTPAHERLRIAYLAPDFHEHPSAHLLVELIEQHDRTRFETFGICLHDGPESDIRGRFGQAFEHFIEAGTRSDAEVAEMLRQSEIDIAVDLAGHAGGARQGIFTLRPAPLAVNFAGHPGTSGADWIDYILADAVVIPPGGEEHFSESVVRLPDCYLPNDTRYDAASPPTREEAGLPEKGMVFCSFNSNYKITPEMFDIWMRLLRNAEGSVLWLLAENATARRHLLSEAQARGVEPSRLIFADRVSRSQHLGRQVLADLFLDALPCNAHTTAGDALWMGVPLITCMGRSFAARVAGSMLTAAGMTDLITHGLAEYEGLALDLARSPERLRGLRDKLAANRRTCALFDMARLARHVERAYAMMWQRHAQGKAASGFNVPASGC